MKISGSSRVSDIVIQSFIAFAGFAGGRIGILDQLKGRWSYASTPLDQKQVMKQQQE
jgi:hypothetical protein